jgi:hypothetical protein
MLYSTPRSWFQFQAVLTDPSLPSYQSCVNYSFIVSEIGIVYIDLQDSNVANQKRIIFVL